MIKVHGILFVEDIDKHGEIVSVKGATIKDHAPVKSANGNLLGKVIGWQAVYRAITDESVSLAMKNGLKVTVSDPSSENVVTGGTHLELEKPFIKINATLLENTHLREAIRNKNLFFALAGNVVEKSGNLIVSCNIDSVLVTISPAQTYTRIYLD